MTLDRTKQRSMQGKALSFTHVGDCLEVELHLAPCNEIGTLMLSELEELAAYIRDGAGAAPALIFHSSIDGGFCAGADLRELHAGLLERKRSGATRGEASREVRSFLDRIHTVLDTIDMANMTTIGALHGVVFGGGFELALTCDILIADKSTRFCFPELRLGLIPGFGGIPRLRRDVGNAIVRDLLMTGRSLNAKRAHEVGLVSQVVARGEALGVARRVAEQAARFDGATTTKAKAFMKNLPRADLHREKEVFIDLFTSDVVEQALERFVNSRDVLPYLP